jgi:hypothetical protein
MLVAKRTGVEYESKYHAVIYQILRILRKGHGKNLTGLLLQCSKTSSGGVKPATSLLLTGFADFR